jgi:small subunit ribosomal protein S1
MDKGVVVDMGNDIEGFVPVSQLAQGGQVTSPADVVYEGMNLDMRVLEVDPIHRRIVLTVTSIPDEQPPRPETPPTVHPSDELDGDASVAAEAVAPAAAEPVSESPAAEAPVEAEAQAAEGEAETH